MSAWKEESIYKKLIVIEKLIRGPILVVLSFGTLPFFSKEVNGYLLYIARIGQLQNHAVFIRRYLLRFIHASMRSRFELSAIFFVWGILEIIEGFGLLYNKRWSEYMIVILTGLSVPIDLFFTVRRFSAEKLVFLTLNILIVIYLAHDLHRKVIATDKESRNV